jgi:hypothetical protein
MSSHPALLRPSPGDYPTEVEPYLRVLPKGDLLEILVGQRDRLVQLVGPLTDAEALTRHAPYTWSIKQVIGHLTDCEHIFGYRALRLARNDETPLPSFDENAYMRFVDFDRRPTLDLLAEFESARRSHLLMFRGLAPDAWLRSAVVNNHRQTVQTIACVMAGHTEHHLQILVKRLGR